MKQALLTFLALLLVFSAAPGRGQTHSNAFTHKTYDPGELKPTDSELKVAVGDKAPDFKLPAVSGEKVALSR